MAKGFLIVCLSFFFLVPNVFTIASIANEKVDTAGPMTATSLPDHQTTSSNQNEDHVSITRAAAAAPVPLPPRAGGNNHQSSSKSAGLSVSPASNPIPEHGKADPAAIASAAPPFTAAHPHVETTPDENHGSEAAESTETSGAESPLGSRKLANHRHHHYHPSDKSVAGGVVILVGLATTFLASIACYIRATRKRNKNNKINNINDGENDPQESSPGINTK